MVGAALIHFVAVELRPLISLGVSSLSIYGALIQTTHNSETACTCVPGCTEQQTIDQNNNLLRSAMVSFSQFNATSSCMSVQIVTNFQYAWFYVFLLAALGIVLSICIGMFIVEACKQKFTSIQSGAYFAFTLELGQRCLYRVAIKIYIFSLVVVFLVGIVLILIQFKMNFQLMWTVAQREIFPLLVLLLSSQQLLAPANLTEFSSWNMEKLRQVCFQRSWCGLFFDSNEALYQRIGVATIEATRGNTSYLNALVLRPEDASELMQALNLPFDWSSLLDESTKPSSQQMVEVGESDLYRKSL
ncbi:Hypothetical protein SCF082_LOCUS1712 [Durusdinium trenchii]|uniref:Uncharacterized protein n=1 Tax=Durusdinium trenchii TaxID=1381693 RepID=A0ABP0HK30_9DINO